MKKAIIYSVMLMLALASCKPAAKSTVSQPSKETRHQKLTSDQMVTYTGYYFNASREKMLGNYEEAIQLYKQCIKLNPEEASPYYELATIFTNQNKYADALQLARKAAELSPKNEWFLYLYAGLLERTKQFNEAVNVFQK